MNEFLKEITRLWWVEVGIELQNPLSEKSIRGLRKVLKEEIAEREAKSSKGFGKK